MSQVYARLFYHVVWRTYLSRPDITPRIERFLFPFMKNKAKRFHCFIYEVNGTEDHVHLAIAIPPSVAVSDIIGRIKGSSSYFLNNELQITTDFSWQGGFGMLSFDERDLPGVINYIRNQKMHHKSGNLRDALEKDAEDEEG